LNTDESREEAEGSVSSGAPADHGTGRELAPSDSSQTHAVWVQRPAPDDTAAVDRLIHELGVHQVQLERQNEQLRHAQTQLEASRDSYASLFDHAPIGYLTMHSNGVIAQANRRAADLLGVPREFLAGRRLSEFVAGADRGTLRSQASRIVGAGGVSSFELQIAPEREPPRRVAVQMDRMENSAPGPVLLRAALLDIEEQCRLREDLARLASIVSSSDDAIVSRDLDGRVTSWNDGARRLFGYTAEETLGQTLDALVPQDRRAEEWTVLTRLRHGETIAHLETERLARGGTRVPVSISLAPTRDQHKQVVGSSMIARDISERRRADRALRERLRQLDVLCQAGQALILRSEDLSSMQQELFDRLRSAVGCDLLLEYVTDGAGETAQLGRAVGFDEAHPAGPQSVRFEGSAFGATVRRGAPLVVDGLEGSDLALEPLRAAGARCLAAFPLRSSERCWGLVVFASGQRNEFGQGNVQIIQTVCDQMSAMLERSRLLDDLHASEQALRAADRAKDAFIATLAHELRNPLAPIRNAVELMRREESANPRRVAWCRDIIARQVAQLSHLLEDLLDISRLTRNRVELRRETLDVRTTVELALESTRPLIESRRHTCALDLPPTPVLVDADPTRLTQVFTNLLNNAAKYTESGGTIRVTVEPSADQVRVAVRDDGIGIAREDLPKIFEMFSQVTGRAAGGLGIGLALTRGLVEMHGGRVEARSEGLGRGSEFVVTLPRLPHQASGDVPRLPVGEQEQRAKVHAQFRVLVVDDNVDAAQTLASVLVNHGQEVRTAYGGQSALEIAAQWRPDAVFLDLGMPDMSGLEVCRLLRESMHAATPLIVACTGWGRQEDRARSSAAGFDAHLVKPVEPGAVLNLLQSLPQASHRA
jgi:PAS domain S-box-containing protein